MIRAFVALPATAAVQQQLIKIRSELERADADVKWDDAEKYHITLKFMGDVDEALIPSLEELLRRSFVERRAFAYVYAGLGVFPNAREPRVVWVGVSEGDKINALQSTIEDACFRIGLPRENRPFHPHITLGRVKGQRNRARLIEGINTVTFEPISTFCSSVQIIRSELHREGSRYTILKNIILPT
jgi:RNA 2',3'-cyclic 3'-phosphodiesterase